MTGFLGAYADGQDLHGADLNADTATLAANDAAALNLLTGGWNLLVAGCTLTAPGGLVVDVALGQVVVNGVILDIAADSVTCVTNSGQANPRVDAVYVQLLPGGASGTNASSGNPTKADSYVLGVQQGANAPSPVAPTLGGVNYVQIGVVNVPAGASSIASGNLGSQVTAPNAQGPTGGVVVLALLHMAASMATAAVHGFQVDAQGGVTPGRIPQLDAFGAVERAQTLYDSAGIAHPAAESGTNGIGYVAVYNPPGRVVDSQMVGGRRSVWGHTGTITVPANGSIAFTATLDDATFTPSQGVATVTALSPATATCTSFGLGTASGIIVNTGGAAFAAAVTVLTTA